MTLYDWSQITSDHIINIIIIHNIVTVQTVILLLILILLSVCNVYLTIINSTKALVISLKRYHASVIEHYNGFIIQHIDNKTQFDEKISLTNPLIYRYSLRISLDIICYMYVDLVYVLNIIIIICDIHTCS